MAGKKKAEQPKETSIVQPEDDKAKDRKMAEALMRPSVQAAFTIHAFEKSKVDVLRFVDELTAQIEAVNGGDLKRAEAILITQAHTLNELFNSLARKACDQQYLDQYETFLRLALKAQTQCRATLETLSTIKNPPVVYAKQANFANGPQQVNNGVPARPPHMHAREEKTIQSNELLTDGVEHGQTLDTRGTAAAGSVDKELAAVGSLDRAKVAGR